MTIPSAQIAIIGGSGLYNVDQLKVIEEVDMETPWGKPSDAIVIAETPSTPPIRVAFLARHGRGHNLNPSEVNARANIAALKKLGVQVILAFSAVGSLREDIHPRDFVLPTQIMDRTKGIRPSTFFEKGVVGHVSFGDPFEKELADLIYAQKSALLGNVAFHRDKTLVCMEGPAFSTRAESNLYRQWGGDVINMSVLPEAKLAREAEICYQMVCMATDYDCWRVEEEAVSTETVLGNLKQNSENAKRLLVQVLPILSTLINAKELKCVEKIKMSAKYAVMTAPEKRNPEQVAKLNFILPGYF